MVVKINKPLTGAPIPDMGIALPIKTIKPTSEAPVAPEADLANPKEDEMWGSLGQLNTNLKKVAKKTIITKASLDQLSTKLKACDATVKIELEKDLLNQQYLISVALPSNFKMLGKIDYSALEAAGSMENVAHLIDNLTDKMLQELREQVVTAILAGISPID